MNLYDLVRRKDRYVVVTGELGAVEVRRPGGMVRAIAMTPGAELRIRDAHGATCLAHFPAEPGWRIDAEAGANLQIAVAAGDALLPLADVRVKPGATADVGLDWPVPTPRQFDLVLRATGRSPLHLVVGPHMTPRTALLPLLRGRGVEVGPGLNPVVRPARGIEVRYVEKKHPRDWAATYAKRELTAAEMALWDHYVVDSARFLTGFEPGSLDFVFSNHVLEHLVDPIGTLARWWERLAPGGILAGVVPDARFTFDWRQPRWSIEDVRAQRALVADEPTEAMYERWCRYTSPENTPASLRARDYSIHVTYLTPELMRQILDDVIATVQATGQPEPDALYMQSVPNGKDFGFVLQKPVR